MRWPPPGTPTIVAEALHEVPHPVRTALRAGPEAAAPEVVRALAAGIALPAAPDAPPGWLLPSQHRAYARALAALRTYRGAILAEPTGSGKTYIALAVAWRWQRTPVACIVPAPLVDQWRATAARLGLAVVVTSHEQASRGRLPAGTRGLVLVDESHHFRHPEILRYRHVAAFLAGRAALLLTATPVVNRVEDVAHQLRLVVRDDALALEGLDSLAAGIRAAPAALGAVLIATDAARERIPLRATRRVVTPLANGLRPILTAIDGLALSSDPGVARLVRGVLWRAMASSPAALAAALRRYHLLLSQARDAAAAGHALSRRTLRQWAGAGGDQLVLWSVVPGATDTCDLSVADAPALPALIEASRATAATDDPRLSRLRSYLADGTRTLVFTGSRDTVAWLRRRLGGPVGWCTGDAAGIGTLRLSRAALLAAFAAEGDGPRVIIASDVAAEGLDLQAAARVVHYDLPWTAARLRQREGRAARLGSRHAVVAVIRFDPPAPLERRLRQCRALLRSARAPGLVGIGAAQVWQWRDLFAERFGGGPAFEGTAAVRSRRCGALAGLAFDDDRCAAPPGAALLWLDSARGTHRSDPAWLGARLDEAMTAPPREYSAAERDDVLGMLAGPAELLLRRRSRARWAPLQATPGVRVAIRRLTTECRDASRRRSLDEVALLERALAVAGGGLTAGETAIVERAAVTGDRESAAAIAALPPRSRPPGAIAVRLTGLILFAPG